MAGSLTQAQVEHFRREGYAFPFDAIPAAEAASYVAKLDGYDAILGEEAQKQSRSRRTWRHRGSSRWRAIRTSSMRSSR